MTYSFHCCSCNKDFDMSIAVREYATTVTTLRCPYCNSSMLTRIYVPTVVIYKADGFTLRRGTYGKSTPNSD